MKKGRLNEGFTLIELLAVIIILAVIALIATPKIVEVMDDAKDSVRKSKLALYADSLKLKRTEANFNNQSVDDNDLSSLDVDSGKISCTVKKYTTGVILDNCTIDDLDTRYCFIVDKIYTGDDCNGKVDIGSANNCPINNGIKVGNISQVVLSNFPELELSSSGGCKNPDSTNYTYMDGCYTKKVSGKEKFLSKIAEFGIISEQGKAQFFNDDGSFNGQAFENWFKKLVGITDEQYNAYLASVGKSTIFEVVFEMDSNTLFCMKSENYIWYSGFMYRIMGINYDGTVRLISEENIASIPWSQENQALDYLNSYARNWLNSYFLPKLKGTDAIASNGNFCFSVATTASPSNTTCTGTIYSDKIGLLTSDEYTLSSSGLVTYLNNNQWFWEMTAHNEYSPWYIQNFGNSHISGGYLAFGLRPILNINANTSITAGDGTIKNSYILNETKANISNKSITEANISSGEYINYSGHTYRVVSSSAVKTTLILDGYYQETSGVNYVMKFGDDSQFIVTNRVTNGEANTNIGIGYKLNGDVLEWLVPSTDNINRSKLIMGNWYQNFISGTDSYTVSLDESGTSISATVGLIRKGEMLSGESETILSKNHTVLNNYSNSESYWTLTPSWYVHNNNGAQPCSMNCEFSVRPVINVKSGTIISSGKGTPESPYEI